MSYDFNAIEEKWQRHWKTHGTFKAKNPEASSGKPAAPFYVLDMFPYPSGAGLHVGHPLGYIASDIVARYKRHKGFNVLHPMGYDSFGLPAEQYAIQTGQHPAITTHDNIKRYREQLDKIGFSFDWSREVRTSDPAYYRWTQWIFMQLFDSWYDKKTDKARPISELTSLFSADGNTKTDAVCAEKTKNFSAQEWNGFSEENKQEILLNYRLTYLAETEVNWCPGLGTVLANDEIVNGLSERGGFPVERKKMKQWSMRITAYAERLLQGLETIDWSDSLKESQRNWIGKSEGAKILFPVIKPSLDDKAFPLGDDLGADDRAVKDDASSYPQPFPKGKDGGKVLPLGEDLGGDDHDAENDNSSSQPQPFSKGKDGGKDLPLGEDLGGDDHDAENDNSSSQPQPFPKGRGQIRDNNFNWKTGNPTIAGELLRRAKKMRKNPTKAEALLWNEIRSKKTGYKFRFQHPIDDFIVDFVCLSRKLIIEVDGDIHDYQKEDDEKRQLKLEQKLGYKIIRFRNEEILKNIDFVLNRIIEILKERPLFTGKAIPLGDDLGADDRAVKDDASSYPQLFPKGKDGGKVLPFGEDLGGDDHDAKDGASSQPQPFSKGRAQGLDSPNILKKSEENNISIPVFTTRPDTVFGVTYMTLAPEHELVQKITTPEQKEAVENYVRESAKRSERDRMADTKTVSGVFTGAYAEHPFTEEPIPIWVGDYVLAGYGTGAVMAVPAGDERDHRFATHFQGQKGMAAIMPIFELEDGSLGDDGYFMGKEGYTYKNSGFLDGLAYPEALRKIISELERKGFGKGTINYRLRDAVFSRQRYWGEPFPVYYKNGLPYLIPEDCLPLKLPEVEKYLPTKDGKPPLGRAKTWAWHEKNKTVVSDGLIDHKSVFPLELNTMPGWAGSSWYFFRYMEAADRKEVFASKEAMAYWKNVNLYIGGSEHATGHLLYARFWTKFLKDRGWGPVEEPFQKLINQGMILGESAFVFRVEGKNEFISKDLVKNQKVHPIHADVSLVNVSNELDIEGFKAWRPEFENADFITGADGKFPVSREVEKMSKSKYNVVNPDDICRQYGADTLRLYEMFLGPLDQAKPWNTAGLSGVHSFLNKLWRLYHQNDSFSVSEDPAPAEALKTLHHTIKKATEDIAQFSFNTTVSEFMICVNTLAKLKCNHRDVLEPLAVLVSPYAPHIAEELWEKLGHAESISTAAYPVFEEKHIRETAKTYPISFNGKKRFTMDIPLDMPKDEIEKTVMADQRTQDQLNGRTPKRVIIVPGRIVNIVG